MGLLMPMGEVTRPASGCQTSECLSHSRRHRTQRNSLFMEVCGAVIHDNRPLMIEDLKKRHLA